METTILDTHVIRFGHGERHLVILPGINLCGLSGQGDAIAGAYALLAEQFTCTLIDRKKNIPDGHTIRDMAEDAIAVCKALGIPKACLFAVSLGGMIAQTIAIDHPEFVQRLCIGSTTPKPTADSASLMREWISLAEAGLVEELNDSFSEHVYSPGYREKYKEAFAALRSVGTAEDCIRFAHMAKAIPDFDVSHRLSEIVCPAMSIHSEDDHVFPVTDYPFHQKLYTGFGHAVYDEAPDYREHLLRFLTAE